MIMTQRAHLYYSGKVQGVGFRYTVRDIAGRLGVRGWVKNLPDSRVELLAEAEEADLKQFLDNIKECFFRYIREVDISWEPAADDVKDFNIKF